MPTIELLLVLFLISIMLGIFRAYLMQKRINKLEQTVEELKKKIDKETR